MGVAKPVIGGVVLRRDALLNGIQRRVVPQVLTMAAQIRNWRGRDGNDPSVDIAKDADQRF